MLKTRALTALVLLALFLSALFYLPAAGFVALAAVATAGAASEWGRLCGLKALASRAVALLVGAGVALIASYNPADLGIRLIQCVGVFWLLVAPLWLVFKWPMKGPIKGLASVLLGAVLI
ncbi:MAG: hypothetical protein RIR70_2248, partial [Pseudomonadota bacterium]